VDNRLNGAKNLKGRSPVGSREKLFLRKHQQSRAKNGRDKRRKARSGTKRVLKQKFQKTKRQKPNAGKSASLRVRLSEERSRLRRESQKKIRTRRKITVSCTSVKGNKQVGPPAGPRNSKKLGIKMGPTIKPRTRVKFTKQTWGFGISSGRNLYGAVSCEQ